MSRVEVALLRRFSRRMFMLFLKFLAIILKFSICAISILSISILVDYQVSHPMTARTFDRFFVFLKFFVFLFFSLFLSSLSLLESAEHDSPTQPTYQLHSN